MLMRSFINDNLFDDFFGDLMRPSAKTNYPYMLMGTDVKENEDGYELMIELPGCKKEDVKAELKDGYLTVSAHTNKENETAENGKYIRRERYSGSCSRSYYVGKDIKQEEIKAKFEDGLLKIAIPKPQIEAPKENNRFIAIEG